MSERKITTIRVLATVSGGQHMIVEYEEPEGENPKAAWIIEIPRPAPVRPSVVMALPEMPEAA